MPLLATVLVSCASRGPALDRMDADALFARGMEQLAARKWSDAADAFRRLTLVYPNDVNAQEARFRLGESYQGRREWVTAALEFNRLASDHPASPWAERARYQACLSYYELSPRPQLDQEYTAVAIEHCRALALHYPNGEFTPRAREIIDELTSRLAEKEYLAAEHYFNRRAMDSAIIYYQVITTEYPTTVWAPRALLRMYQAYERLGYEQEATSTRERLLRDYPASTEARQLAGADAGT
jgi:outer membrane protein assembly factor BamD